MITAIKNLDDYNGVIKWRVTHNCNFSCSYCIQKYCVSQPEVWGTLEEDEARCLEASSDVSRIMDEMQATSIKLDIIGGEVTLFDLETLISKITSTKLKKVYIITNLHKSVEYFESLANALKARDCTLEICASWHAEYLTFDVYCEKLLALKEIDNIKIKCEKVNTGSNTEEIEKLKTFCEENEINYLIDVDTTFSRTAVNARRCGTLKSYSKKDHARFELYKDDGTTETVMSQNELITGQIESAVDQITYLREGFLTKDWYCTRDIDFVYIAIDYHMGIVDGACKGKELLSDFHIRTQPHKCDFTSCNFCGRMSVAKDKETLLNFLEEEGITLTDTDTTTE